MIKWWKDKDRLATGFLEEHAVGLNTILEKANEWTLERAAEEASVKTEHIRNLAEAYADASPAVLRCGWGLERNRNGGQAAAAIIAMPSLLGKFGVRGGGYTLSNGGAVSLTKSKLWEEPSPQTRIINMTQLGKALTNGLEPPIRGLFVYNCNPGRDRTGSERDPRRHEAGRSVYGGLRPNHDRLGALRRHPFARHHISRASGHSTRLRQLRGWGNPAGDRSTGRSPSQLRGLCRARPYHGIQGRGVFLELRRSFRQVDRGRETVGEAGRRDYHQGRKDSAFRFSRTVTDSTRHGPPSNAG